MPEGAVPTPVRGDFHMHTWYSKDCVTPPKSLVARALKVGLTCIAVTEHNNVEGALAVKKLAPPELKVIIAEEVKTTHGEITGFFLEKTIPPGLSPLETCKRIKEQGGLVSIPHPFDRVRRYVLRPEVFEPILPYVDIVEIFNARTTFLRDSNKALAFATEHRFVTGAGSDAHCAWELGHVFVEMPDFSGPQEFKAALGHAKIRARRSTPLVHAVSKFNTYRKKIFGYTVKPA
jgi:predicted metal-dependent phosphoesterase TrpH